LEQVQNAVNKQFANCHGVKHTQFGDVVFLDNTIEVNLCFTGKAFQILIVNILAKRIKPLFALFFPDYSSL